MNVVLKRHVNLHRTNMAILCDTYNIIRNSQRASAILKILFSRRFPANFPPNPCVASELASLISCAHTELSIRTPVEQVTKTELKHENEADDALSKITSFNGPFPN